MLSPGDYQSPGGGRDKFSGFCSLPLPISSCSKCFHPLPPFAHGLLLMLVDVGLLWVEDGDANSGTEGREGVLLDAVGRGMGVVA